MWDWVAGEVEGPTGERLANEVFPEDGRWMLTEDEGPTTADNEGPLGGVGEKPDCAALSDFFLAGLRSGGGFFLMGRATLGCRTTGGEASPD
jgi:hypothetical protein